MRHLVAGLAILALLAGCAPPLIIEIAAEAPVPEAADPEAPAPEPVPIPLPPAGHIWVVDALDAIVYDCEAGDWAGAYSMLLQAVKLDCEVHNRDWPLDPWHYVEGGPL